MPFAIEWQSQLKARTTLEYRHWAGLLAACRRAKALMVVMISRGWPRYSALSRQLEVIGRFDFEDSWWPKGRKDWKHVYCEGR